VPLPAGWYYYGDSWRYYGDYTFSTSTTIGWSDWTANNYTGSTTCITWSPQVLNYVTEIEAVADEMARRPIVSNCRIRAASRTEAIARGEALLLSLLDEAQQASYRRDGCFEVIGSHGTRYRVTRGTSGNILWIASNGDVGGRLCAHPTMEEQWLPTADVMLAQMLALTTDEREFLRVANVHEGRVPQLV